MLTDPSTPPWFSREQAGTREAPHLTTAQEFSHFSPFGAPTKPPRVCFRGRARPSCGWCNLRRDRYDFDAKVFNRIQVSCSNYSHEIMVYSTGYLFWESCLFSQDCWIQSVLFVCFVYLLFRAVIFTLLSSVNPIKFSTSNAGIFIFQSLFSKHVWFLFHFCFIGAISCAEEVFNSEEIKSVHTVISSK